MGVIIYSKTLLVLGGGGAAGAYEIGVLKYIVERNIEIDGVYGVSAGALNGAGFVMGRLDEIEKLWTSIKKEDIFDFDPFNHAQNLKPFILDPTPLYTFLKGYISEKKILESPIDYGILTFNLDKLKAVFLKKEDMKEHMVDYIFASASYPLFGAIEIDGKKYTDGGVFSNVYPALLAEKYGYNKMIAVFPVMNSPADLIFKIMLDMKKSDNMAIITPSGNVPFPMNFSPEDAKRLIEMGYMDAKRNLKNW